MKLLVTGFGPFPGVPFNTTEAMLTDWMCQPPSWPYEQVRFEVLTTQYQFAGARVAELLRGQAPDYLLLLGVALAVGVVLAAGVRDELAAAELGDFWSLNRKTAPAMKPSTMTAARPAIVHLRTWASRCSRLVMRRG